MKPRLVLIRSASFVIPFAACSIADAAGSVCRTTAKRLSGLAPLVKLLVRARAFILKARAASSKLKTLTRERCLSKRLCELDFYAHAMANITRDGRQ